MTILIFGANGNVGQLLVAAALERGFTVRAFVHNHNDLPDHSRLTVVKGDVFNPDDIAKALEGTDAVLSALSSWKAKDKTVLSTAMNHVIPSMQQRRISRIVSLTGAEARAQGDTLSLIHRIAHIGIGLFAGGVLRDGEKHIELLSHSGLDWTVVRSPIMRSGDREVYALSDRRPLPWKTVSRHAVASAMLAQLDDEHLSQQAPFVV